MSEAGEPAPSGSTKGASAFRTIGEVADDLDLPAHVLRFWESKFTQLKPLKRRGGRRYYRPEDILLLRRIRQCLYQDGYTIRGVQKLLGGGEDAVPADSAPSLFPLDGGPQRTRGLPEPASPRSPTRRPRRRAATPDTRQALEEIRRELLEARALLDELTRRSKPR